MSNQHLHQLKIRCPACDTGRLRMTPETALSAQCDHCQAGFPLARGFLDLRPDTSQHRTFSQKLMEWKPLVNRYESRWWRSGFLSAWLFGISFREEQSLIFQLADLQGDERVLDLACGPGTYTLPFARQLPEGYVAGLDLSVPMLVKGATKIREAAIGNVLFLHGNAEHLPFPDDEFHHVNCCGALHLFADLPRALKEIHRVLKPGGRMTATACRNWFPAGFAQTLAASHHRHFGVRLFRARNLESHLRQAGFGKVRWHHKKRYWMVLSAAKVAGLDIDEQQIPEQGDWQAEKLSPTGSGNHNPRRVA
jgi:SAM-dependent methyltransferase